MEEDDNCLLIVGDPQGILGQQLRPCPIQVRSQECKKTTVVKGISVK